MRILRWVIVLAAALAALPARADDGAQFHFEHDLAWAGIAARNSSPAVSSDSTLSKRLTLAPGIIQSWGDRAISGHLVLASEATELGTGLAVGGDVAMRYRLLEARLQLLTPGGGSGIGNGLHIVPGAALVLGDISVRVDLYGLQRPGAPMTWTILGGVGFSDRAAGMALVAELALMAATAVLVSTMGPFPM